MSMSRILTFVLLIAMAFSSTVVEAKSRKEERREQQLRAGLEEPDPRAYCPGFLHYLEKGFFPYCSPATYPESTHSFTARAAQNSLTGVLAEWQSVDGRVIQARAASGEGALIEDVSRTPPSDLPNGCLGATPATCIAFLSARFPVTTAVDIPFYEWRDMASFDEDKGRRKSLKLQLVLPHTDMNSYVKDGTFDDRTARFDVAGLSAYVVDGIIESVSLSGRYPILSDNPNDYAGSGFHQFMIQIFPSCAGGDDQTFYREVWANLVANEKFSESNGRWRATNNGISKSYSSWSSGELCGLNVGASRNSGRSITDEGRMLSGSSKEIRFTLPR